MKQPAIRHRDLIVILGLVTVATVVLTYVNTSGKTTGTKEKDYDVLLLCSSCGHLEQRPSREVFFELDAARRAIVLNPENPPQDELTRTQGLPCARCKKHTAFPQPLQCPRCKHYYHPIPTPAGVIDIVCPRCNHPLANGGNG